jgi:hypothetical protein
MFCCYVNPAIKIGWPREKQNFSFIVLFFSLPFLYRSLLIYKHESPEKEERVLSSGQGGAG